MSSPDVVIKEHPSYRYYGRTVRNATSSDLTVAFAVDFDSPGEVLTKKWAGNNYVAVDLRNIVWMAEAERIVEFFDQRNSGRIVNVAGNAIRKLTQAGIDQDSINWTVYKTLKLVHAVRPIAMIRSGGQSGADIAGAVAGYCLQIPTEVLMPKGFRQRSVDDLDYFTDEFTIRQQILNGAAAMF